jgi:hypothetical protein
MKKGIILVIGLLFLLATEILKVYFIMPFPGSQKSNTIDIAYFIHTHIWLLRIIGIIITIIPLLYFLRKGRQWQKAVLIITLLFYGLIVYAFNFKFLADKMFHQPIIKSFVTAAADTADKQRLIIGVAINNEAKAYPVEIIGYHHQVRDTVGGIPVMITYCTVCRTGRAYSPFINNHAENFRLVGMDHFNAMFEDATTKSWWQQATGVAIAGPLKGSVLKEIPSQQMTLNSWMNLHPNTLVLQPDKNFTAKYDSLKGYDEGTLASSLEKRDTASWKFKSWVVGIKDNNNAKAYDWNELLQKRVIEDTIGYTNILLCIDKDNKTFYAFNTHTGDTTVLHFNYDAVTGMLKDLNTNSSWKLNGICTDGALKGTVLDMLPAYQEFWHSWQTFHPNTTVYK